jgi:hypothetical protein
MVSFSRMKRRMPSAGKKVFFTVIGISILMTIVNAQPFFNGLFRKPKGTVHLAMWVHWYEDYYFYMSHFTQGAHGAWLVANRYTSEVTPPSFNYWADLLMGKIGGLVGLTPIMSYNLWLIALVFLTLIASFFVIRLFLPKRPIAQLAAFIFSLFADSIMPIAGGHIVWNPIHEMNSPHYVEDRLGGIPRHAAVTLLFYLVTLLIFHTPKTKFQRIAFTILGPLIMILLTNINPVIGGFWVTAAWAYTIIAVFTKHLKHLKRFTTPALPWVRLTIITIAFTITFIYMNALMGTMPHISARVWEAAQSTRPAIGFYLQSGGPLFYMAGIGIVLFFISPQPFLLFAVLLALGTHIAYFSPLPALLGVVNARFIFAAVYPFLAVLAVYCILLCTTYITNKIRGLQQHTIFILVIALFLIWSIPTLAWEINRRISWQQASNPLSYLNYLPADAYEGMLFLSKQLPYDDVVLASYLSHTDVLVPVLTNHTSYSGQTLATINSAEKNRLNVAFFNVQMTPDAARQWMNDKRIRYVLLTFRDIHPRQLETHYPFLKSIYSSTNITIYRVE